MGYSRSKQTLERVRPVLDLVLGFRDLQAIRFPSKNPTKLCYAIRDALAVVKSLPDTSQEKKYTTITEKYRIRIKQDHILFEPREEVSFSDPIAELAKLRTEAQMDVVEATSLIEVVGAVVQHKAEKMVFPNAHFVDGDFERLQRWAALNNYKVTEIEPLTLSRHGPRTTTNSSEEDGATANG